MSIFRKGHYKAIAKVLRKVEKDENFSSPEKIAFRYCIRQLIMMFAQDNPNFSMERFLKAIHDG